MPLTDETIAGDFVTMQTDLADTSMVETVSKIPAGETDIDDTFDVLRWGQRTGEELQEGGFSKEYRFTVRALKADIGTTTEGDVIVMANGDRLRLFRMHPAPSTITVLLDLGDEFQDGDSI